MKKRKMNSSEEKENKRGRESWVIEAGKDLKAKNENENETVQKATQNVSLVQGVRTDRRKK